VLRAGRPRFDTGDTGLALLAFLGAGFSHLSRDEFPDPARPGKTLRFGDTVKNGLKCSSRSRTPRLHRPAPRPLPVRPHDRRLALSEGYG